MWYVQHVICQVPYHYQNANDYYQDRLQNRSELQDQV